MVSETFHISENATTWDEGWNATPASANFAFMAYVYMQIKSVSIRVGCNTSNDITGNFYITVNSAQVFTSGYELKSEDGNSQWVSFSPNIIVNVADSVNIYTELGSARQGRAYYGTSGGFPLGAINNPTSAAEMILDIDYVPIWTLDGQNDGYAYPTGTDPTPFTEFEKDKNGYPKNFGVWKLDGQNDGYPWPVGYVPIRQNGDIVKIMQNGAWRDTAGCKVFTNGGAQDAFLKIKSSPPME